MLLKESADSIPIRAPVRIRPSQLARVLVTDAISEGNFAILVAPFILTVSNKTDGNRLSFYVLRWIGSGTLVPG